MKKIYIKLTKNLLASFLSGFLSSIILFGIMTYVSASIVSSKVSFDDTNTTTNANYVQDAIDNLNNKYKEHSINLENYSQNVLNFLYPIGSIYISTENESPESTFGGVWKRFAKGRVLVGYSESETEFDEIKEEGGSKFMQKHYHNISSFTLNTSGSAHQHAMYYKKFTENGSANPHYVADGGSTRNVTLSGGAHYHTVVFGNTNSVGSGNRENLQPYITVYMWERTS